MSFGEWFLTGAAVCFVAIVAVLAAVLAAFLVFSWPLARLGLYDPPKLKDEKRPPIGSNITFRWSMVRVSSVVYAFAVVVAALTAIGYVIEVVAA